MVYRDRKYTFLFPYFCPGGDGQLLFFQPKGLKIYVKLFFLTVIDYWKKCIGEEITGGIFMKEFFKTEIISKCPSWLHIIKPKKLRKNFFKSSSNIWQASGFHINNLMFRKYSLLLHLLCDYHRIHPTIMRFSNITKLTVSKRERFSIEDWSVQCSSFRKLPCDLYILLPFIRWHWANWYPYQDRWFILMRH